MSGLDPNALMTDVSSLVVEWGVSVLGALILFVVGRWVAARLRDMTRRASDRADVDPTLSGFLSVAVYWLILAFVIVAVLGIFGIPTASFVALLGAAGLAIGLAFQGTFSNFASGVMLLLFRPISVDDYVEVGGTAGTVQRISIFSTILDTPDNVRTIVPNSEIFGQTIKNYSANDTRRIDLVVGVDYGDDLQRAHDTILGIVEAEDRVLEEPAPVVAVDELGASSVDFVVRPWVATSDYWTVRRDLVRALKEGLEAADLSFPYPQRDVHLFQEPAGA